MQLRDEWEVTLEPGRFWGWWARDLARRRAVGGWTWGAWAPTKDGALRKAYRAARSVERSEQRRALGVRHTLDLELDPEPEWLGPF